MNLLTVNLLLSTLVFWIAAKLYLLPRLQDLDVKAVLVPILLLHAMRHLGLMFLAPGGHYPGLPTQFSYPSAIGDLLTATLALVALAAIVRQAQLAHPLVLFFNVFGTVDLLSAIALATAFGAAEFMGPAYWIPAFWVPALLVTHYIVFLLLRSNWENQEKRQTP